MNKKNLIVQASSLFLAILFIIGCSVVPSALPKNMPISSTYIPISHMPTLTVHIPTPSAPKLYTPTLITEILQRLTIAETVLYPVQMTPGSSYNFDLGTIECCYYLIPVEADVSWSVKPEVGAQIDSHNGSLKIDASTPHGSIFTVTANVENGRSLVSTNVYVYTIEGNPLIGIWREEAHHSCTDRQWVASDLEGSNEPGLAGSSYVPMGELAFNADGTFKATWFPLEIFYNYSGTYTYNLDQGLLVLNFSTENVPKDVDESGSFSFDKGKLVLEDIWLGNNWRNGTSAGCGYIFHNR